MSESYTRISKATIVAFLASFITGVCVLVWFEVPSAIILRFIHGTFALLTLGFWIQAIRRDEIIITRVTTSFFIGKYILGITGLIISGGVLDEVVGAFHKICAFLTLVLWIASIRKFKKTQ